MARPSRKESRPLADPPAVSTPPLPTPDGGGDWFGIVKEFVDELHGRHADEPVPQHELLFSLVGRFKAQLKPLDARSAPVGHGLLPFVRLFATQCSKLRIIDPEIAPHLDWSNDEQVSSRFLRLWKKRKHAEGATLFGEAVKMSQDSPVVFSGLANRPQASQIANLARCLQQVQGEEPIKLPIDKVSEALGIPRTSVGDYIHDLVEIGILKFTDPSYIPGRRARSLQYIGEKLIIPSGSTELGQNERE